MKSQGTAYDRVQITNQRAEISEGFWQYALLPVWTLTYKERQGGKIYYFAMNGQTGKVCGELPVDKGKLMILFCIHLFAAADYSTDFGVHNMTGINGTKNGREKGALFPARL